MSHMPIAHDLFEQYTNFLTSKTQEYLELATSMADEVGCNTQPDAEKFLAVSKAYSDCLREINGLVRVMLSAREHALKHERKGLDEGERISDVSIKA